MYTDTARKEAKKSEADGDALALRQLAFECCDEIDRLRKIITNVKEAWLNYGPVDDGTPEGDGFSAALDLTLGESGKRPKRKKGKAK